MLECSAAEWLKSQIISAAEGKENIMKMGTRIIIKGFYWFSLLLLLAISLIVVFSKFNNPLGMRLFSVKSGSMEPSIRVGSIVMVKGREEYQAGDMITVRMEKNAKETFTHRVVEVVENEELGRISYRTKGDANPEADRELVPKGRILGKVILIIPYLGYPVAIAQTQMGLTFLIIIPAALIVYSEAINIKNEIGKIIKKRRNAGWKEKEKKTKGVKNKDGAGT